MERSTPGKTKSHFLFQSCPLISQCQTPYTIFHAAPRWRNIWLWRFQITAVVENVPNGSLDGEQVIVVDLGTVKPHELGQSQQVFGIVARVAPTDGDLGGDLLVRRRAEVGGAGRGCNIDKDVEGVQTLLLRDELRHHRYVTPQHNLSHVQVLKGFFDLRAAHFVGHAPCASLMGKQTQTVDELMNWSCYLLVRLKQTLTVETGHRNMWNSFPWGLWFAGFALGTVWSTLWEDALCFAFFVCF